MPNFSELITLQKQISDMVRRIREDIIDDIQNGEPLGGVSVSRNKGLQVVEVKLSTVVNNGMVLTPCYYIPAKQAELVERALANVSDPVVLRDKISSMVENKAVRFSEGTYSLNPRTLAILSQVFD